METEIVETAIEATRAKTALEAAKSFCITTDADLQLADIACVELKEIEKQANEKYDPNIKRWHQGHKAAVAEKKAVTDLITETRDVYKKKIRVYQLEQESTRQAEEKRLQDLSDKAAEDAAIAAAAEAEKAGDKAQAEAILQAPVQAAPVILARTIPKVQTRIPETWMATPIPIERMTNQQIINARAYLCWDTIRLGQQARSTHDTVKVDGVKFHVRPI